MKIDVFKVEQWMNDYEVGAKYNIAETCVDSISLDELFELTGTDKEAFLNDLTSRRLTYGDIEGRPDFKEGVSKLYKTIEGNEIITTHGASGANHHVFYSLIEPGDWVVSIMPTYQQLYSIPASLGADVQLLHLSKSNNYLPDMNQLKELVTENTKLICLNNPNNPTGALMPKEMLLEIVEIARSVGAYILCDEVYRHLTQEDEWCESIVDLYEKGISVSSMSKVFSLAGIRLGWIATHDRELMQSFLHHRDYNLVSCGFIDEWVGALAIQHADIILERNRGLVRKNLAILDNWIQSEPKVSYVKPKAGTTALVYYEYEKASRSLAHDMYHETGAFVTPGDCFEEEYSLRIGYAGDTDELKKGLDAISVYFRKLEKE